MSGTAHTSSHAKPGPEKEQDPLSGKTERILHTILANVDDLIAVVDLNGKRLYNSPSYERIFGEGERKRGSDSFQEVHPDDREMVRRVFQETVATGVGRRIVYRFLVPGRPIRSIESQGNVIRDAQGNVAKVVIVSRDITERKRVEEERTRLDMAVEHAAESIMITDTSGTIVYVNPAFERQTGYPRDEVIGRNPRILKSGAQDEGAYRTLWATLLRGETWSGELINRRKNGTLYREETNISPVRDADGKVINFVAVKRDVTHEREVELHMQQAQKIASLCQLAEGIAHDLNNILNVLEGVIGLLEPRLTEPLVEKYVGLAKGAIQRGVNAGKRLMAFAQNDRPEAKPISPADLLNTLKTTLLRTVERTILVNTTVEGKLPSIQGDEAQVLQALLTVCLNARDAILEAQPSNERGRICISADLLQGRFVRNRFKEATADSYVRFRIADDGAGMTPDVRNHIFEPFFTTRERRTGPGVGLAIVSNTIKGLNGFVDFESEVNKGTTFNFYIPALPIERENPSVSTGPLKGGSETILLVEDEDDLRLVLEHSLKLYGYNVLIAKDGSEGYNVYAQHQQDIAAVVTDMGLPRESGYDMFNRIRTLDPLAKVIFISGYLDPSLRSKVSVAGATDFLAKPFTPPELLTMIRQTLDQIA